ncbi:anti-sigma factor family protein [Actinomadura nitritigenes]|uniref:Zf-HC2 domain-containing protein n=1 Tax=Actinomadura nitritigenes TaxID=134602 RepID=A0ABS3R9K3_9ACTN|nr:zf-HC2 domain-containing protein [Actinomadura nitritigenes]MBO2442916.1 zf-HC2 domain-containing protein [Actinomadura nitritigenes]
MRCPHRIDVGAYALGVLAPADQTRTRIHLEGCPSCRAELADLAAVLAFLHRAAPCGCRPPDLRPRRDR